MVCIEGEGDERTGTVVRVQEPAGRGGGRGQGSPRFRVYEVMFYESVCLETPTPTPEQPTPTPYIEPTPTPIGSIPEFTAENLCQYESGRFEDFSGSYICVNNPLTNWNNPKYKYTRFITNGLYEYDGMVNGKPSYKLENEYGVSRKIEQD